MENVSPFSNGGKAETLHLGDQVAAVDHPQDADILPLDHDVPASVQQQFEASRRGAELEQTCRLVRFQVEIGQYVLVQCRHVGLLLEGHLHPGGRFQAGVGVSHGPILLDRHGVPGNSLELRVEAELGRHRDFAGNPIGRTTDGTLGMDDRQVFLDTIQLALNGAAMRRHPTQGWGPANRCPSFHVSPTATGRPGSKTSINVLLAGTFIKSSSSRSRGPSGENRTTSSGLSAATATMRRSSRSCGCTAPSRYSIVAWADS